ncbi:MAG: hypothetical protein KA534_06180 [Sediminibacterium sp.]|nr:hypothetical protein [Sediminibacterium sp.]
MKFVFALLLFSCVTKNSFSQKTFQIGRQLILTTCVIDKNNKLTSNIKNILEAKLKKITGFSNINESNPLNRFILAAKVNLLTNGLTPGPPQKYVQNVQILVYIGDVETNTIYASTEVLAKGIGLNFNDAMLNIVSNINFDNEKITGFVNEGKSNILLYYKNQCDLIYKKAKLLAKNKHEDEAIYTLLQIPEASEMCYKNSLELIDEIYKSKINQEANKLFLRAKIIWASSSDKNGAVEVSKLLSSIEESAACYGDVLLFIDKINKKLFLDEKDRRDFIKKKYSDSTSLEIKKNDNIRSMAESIYRNKTIINLNQINW